MKVRDRTPNTTATVVSLSHPEAFPETSSKPNRWVPYGKVPQEMAISEIAPIHGLRR
jgi:hypothetical protein